MMLQIKKWIAVKSDKISFLCLKNLVGSISKTLSGRPCFCAQPLMMQNGWKSNQDLQFAREMHSSNTTMLDIRVFLTEYSFILEI